MTTKTDNQQEQKAVVAPVNLDTFDWNAYENDLGVYNAPMKRSRPSTTRPFPKYR